jgi:alpha-N-arabinofuranosidase
MWRPREGGGAPRRRPYGDMLGALGNASVLLAFIRHADRVKIGCMTGGLGVLATANRDQIWRTASYYPYTQLMRYGRGISMRCSVEGDTYDIPSYILDDTNEYYEQEGVNYIDAAAAFDDNAGELNIFLINRDWESDRTIELDATGFTGYKFCEHIQLYSDDITVTSTPENPDAVVPSINSNTKEDEDGIIKAELKKLSWNILRFVKATDGDKA